MPIRLLEPAQQELDDAIAWYANQSPGLDEAFLLEVLKTFKLISQFPQAWHPLGQQVRRCRLNRFPYSVIYNHGDEGLLVVAIAHQHRKPDYWGGRLKTKF